MAIKNNCHFIIFKKELLKMKFNNIQTIKEKIRNEEPLSWVDNALLSGFSKEEIIKMSEPKEQLFNKIAIPKYYY